MLKGRCCHRLYPLPHKIMKRHTFGVVKPSLERWHCHLGHPSLPVVRKVVSTNNLPCLSESNNESVCDSCQRSKSHQLSYPISSRRSSAPLELVFSDVWGPALNSV
jgi:hypothetical protein